MATTITLECGNVDRGTGSVRAALDAVHITCHDAPENNDDGTQKRMRFRVDAPAGFEDLYGSAYSELFAPSADGEHTWEGYIFPHSGAHTVRLHDEEEDSDLATLAVTVV